MTTPPLPRFPYGAVYFRKSNPPGKIGNGTTALPRKMG